MAKKDGKKKGNSALYVLGGLALVGVAAVIMNSDSDEGDEDLDAGRKAPEPDAAMSVGRYNIDIIKNDDGEWQWFALEGDEVVGAGHAMSPFEAKFQGKKWASKRMGDQLKSGEQPESETPEEAEA